MYETGIVEVTDKKYPTILKDALSRLMLSQGPKRLYYKGNWGLLSAKNGENCLAVVGSRRLTQYGQRATQQLVGELSAAGAVIVSGFMYGGDKAAHEAALACGGKTIAVMPCGINLVHPVGQEDLYQSILDNEGLIVSEYEDKAQPQHFTYIQRDRIVAGLSKAVLVTEASLNSGSLITASYAKKFGRKIFALPGQITSQVAQGTIKLIREGAEAVMEAKNILTFFNLQPGAQIALNVASLSFAGNAIERKIIDQLKREPMEADDMARLFAVSVAQLGTTLSLMQLKGIVSQDGGRYYLA